MFYNLKLLACNVVCNNFRDVHSTALLGWIHNFRGFEIRRGDLKASSLENLLELRSLEKKWISGILRPSLHVSMSHDLF